MIVFIFISCIVLAVFFLYETEAFKYWKRRGVKHDKPIPIFGNAAANLLGLKDLSKNLDELYWKYSDEKAVGYFRFSQPELMVRDPDLVKRILISDFNCFYSRSLLETDPNHRNLEILRRNVFVVEGDVWRLLRQSMTHVFSSGKIKAMFPLIVERAEHLQERTFQAAARGPIDAFDLMARYTIDFIGTYGFGIDIDSQKNEYSAFRKLGQSIFQIPLKQVVVVFLKTLFPVMFGKLKSLDRVEGEFCSLINNIMRQKNYKPTNRHDFVDLMLETREKGKIKCESMEKFNEDGTPEIVSMELDDAIIAAQVFVFFAAGFETSASTSSYMLHEIAYNPEKQKKLQADIDRVLAKYDNKLSYEAVQEMHYLEWAFKEGIRIMPPGGYLVRMCRRPCTFHEIGLTVEEGTRVLIPAKALHNDPLYWDSPEEFRPERFSPESNEPRHKFAYLSFGFGPRACIGERLALLQSMAGLAAILSRFSVSPAPTSVRKPPVDPRSNLVQAIKGGLPLIFTPRS